MAKSPHGDMGTFTKGKCYQREWGLGAGGSTQATAGLSWRRVSFQPPAPCPEHAYQAEVALGALGDHAQSCEEW